MNNILVSAHNPMTGPRHLGHHVSTMMEWPKLEKDYECFFVVDDLIATFMYPKARAKIFNRSLCTARDFIACGINLDRSHLLFTSTLWESTELMLLLSNYMDRHFCEHLFEHSFLGMLSPHHRSQMQLPGYSSLAELVYPQIGLPALTLGLQANAFQGGEEISGYVHIMQHIVQRFSAEHRSILIAPEWHQPKTPYLAGHDGTHMTTHNALLVSDSYDGLEELHGSIPDSVLVEWTRALGEHSLADGYSANPAAGRSAALKVLDRHCAPYRECKITSEEILNHAARGAARAKYLLRDTLHRVKDAMRIPEILEY